MRIKDFVPKNFVIHDFYGQETCFAWNSTDEFATFSYVHDNSTVESKLLKAPAEIKDIRGLNGRIYILCFPHGIYKLRDNYEFAILSETGLELVSQFCVLAFKDEMLILEDKTSQYTAKLSPASAIASIYALALHFNNTNNSFYKALSVDDTASHESICLVSVNKKLFKLVNQTFLLIYESEYFIKSMTAFVGDDGQVVGILLQTDSSTVILMHSVENQLFYDQIFLGVNLVTVCPVLCANNSVLLVYSSDEKTCYSSTVLTTNCIRELKMENKIFLSIKVHQPNFIICLDDSSNLLQVSLEESRNLCKDSTSDYVGLQSSMLSGLESTIDIICEKTQELKVLREEMLQKEDCLKRINMYVNKQTCKYCPKDSVLRLLNHLYLICNFESSLLKNSTVVKALKSRGKCMFLMKDVHDYDTIIEMPIYSSNLSSKLYATADLITYKSNNGHWCLVKNYIQDPLPSKSNKTILTKDKRNIIKYNLVVLKNMIKKSNFRMEKLCEIKRKIRCAVDL